MQSLTAEPVSAVAQQKISLYIQYASIVLVWYDYSLTLKQESELFWFSKSPKSRLTICIYILLHYPLVGNLLYLFAVTKKLPNCDDWYKFIGVLSVLGRASVLAVSTLRTYAVYDKSRLVLLTLGTLAISCVAFDTAHLPGLKCVGSASIPIVPTLLSIFVCVLELSATALLLVKVIRIYRGHENLQSSSLTGFVLQQGILYFCGVFAVQFSAVMLNFLAKSNSFAKLLNAVLLPLFCILTSRFLLDLRSFRESQSGGRQASVAASSRSMAWEVASGLRNVVEDLSNPTFGPRSTSAESSAEPTTGSNAVGGPESDHGTESDLP